MKTTGLSWGGKKSKTEDQDEDQDLFTRGQHSREGSVLNIGRSTAKSAGARSIWWNQWGWCTHLLWSLDSPKPSGCRSVQLLPNEGWCFLPPVNVAATSPHKTIYSPLPHQGSTSTFFPSCPTNEIKSKYNPGFNTRDHSKKHEMTVYADQIDNKSRTYNGWSFGSLCFYKPRDSYCQFLSLSHPSFDLSPAMALPVQFTALLVKRHLHVTLENQVFSSESCARTEE